MNGKTLSLTLVCAGRGGSQHLYSKDFYTIVATALRDLKKFARVGRGIYKLKA